MTYEVQMHPWDSVQMHPWDSHLQNQGLGAPYFTSIPLSTLVMTGTASAQYVQQSSHRQDSPIKQEPPSQFLEGSQLRAASVKLEPESTRSPQAVKDWPAFDSGNHSLLIKGQVNNLSGNSERKQPKLASDPARRKTRQKDVKKFPCDYEGCNKEFKQLTHLRIHQRMHTGEKPYKCSLCGFCFSQLGNFNTHLQRHENKKRFRCRKCPKSFMTLYTLKTHTETHTRSTRFTCKVDCTKTFSTLGNLKAHLNKFHRDMVLKFHPVDGHTTAMQDEKEKELREYFAEVYKNGNKGIKGRGQGRKVHHITQATPSTLGNPIASQSPVAVPHGLPQVYPSYAQPCDNLRYNDGYHQELTFGDWDYGLVFGQ